MASSLPWTLPGTWPVQTVIATGAAVTPRLARTFRERRRETMRPADQALAALDERALVQACLGGEAGAFDLIVERHRRSVYLLCYRFVSNHEDASDLAQDVFLRAYRGLRSFRGQSSLGTWLYRIGVNVCLNRVSSKRAESESIDDRQFVDDRI